jgi:tetratricopeptide (TPR) repeat protein
LSARLGKAVGEIVVGGTRNPEAQALFLQAEQLGRSGQTKDISRQQLSLLDAAIALDPRYADAWSLKGNVISTSRNFVTTPEEVMRLRDEGMAASERAVALAPNSGLARISLSIQHRNRLEMRLALADIESALRLAPTDARVVNEAGNFLRLINPDRGVTIARDAVALDPLNPLYVANHAVALLGAHRTQEALVVARQAMAMSNNQYGGNALVTALFGLGRFDEARVKLDEVDTHFKKSGFAVKARAKAIELSKLENRKSSESHASRNVLESPDF